MDNIQILIVMIIYMATVIGIGLYFAKRANENPENYFLGGRSLGPWIAAMSAEASDMSGWLLMGLPGVAYFYGLSDAIWTAIGLLAGTYINWLIVAKRLHAYSIIAGDSITIPEYFSNRFHEKRKIIMTIAALFIMVFFTIYASSCFVTVGKLFSTLFGTPYHYMMIAGAIFVIVYTFLGGFLAESTSDFMQAVVMIVVLVGVLITGVISAGGVGAVYDNLQQIPGFLEFFGISTPTLGADGLQQLSPSGVPSFGEAGAYGLLTILSTLSWGLGYFGMPQVLLRFMAIRSYKEIKKSRRIATVWCAISLFAAVFIGIIGRVVYPAAHLSAADSEKIFITMAMGHLPTILAGLAMAGILAATISSSDSYLLIASSAVSKNIYHGLLKKNATDKQVMNMSRIVLSAISLIGIVIALDETSVIFRVVSFAWAGFGATFGPIMLLSLFWKRTTREGAIAGMLAGGGMVFVWKLLIKPIGGIFGIYELLPAFVLSCIVIVLVSLLSNEPDELLQTEFKLAKYYKE